MERIFGSSSTLTKPNQTSETPSFDALLKQETGSIEDASCSPSTLLKAEQITTGEEDDVMISSYRAKLFSLVNDVWKERGKGSLKLNKSAFIHRLVMRQEVTGRLILNVGCFNDMVGNVEDCWVRFAGVEEDGLVRFLVKLPTKQVAIEFHDAVKSASDTHPVSKSSENLNDAQEKMKLVDLEGKQVDSKVTPKDVDLPAKEKVDVKESDKSGDSVKEDDTSETNSENVEVEDDQDEQVQDKVEQSSKKQRIDL